jgi:TonB family protein
MAYPAIARVARVQGVVVVEVHLDDKGEVISASAISGPKPLTPDCISNAKRWRFKPSAHKKAVVVYEFRLDDGACHDDSHSLFLLHFQNFASITACAPVVGG